MRVLAVLLFLLPVLLLAQENTKDNTKDNTGVELPQFVITGQELINLQQTKKPAPDLIPIISEDFLKPEINPDELYLSGVSEPKDLNPPLRDSLGFMTGRVKAMIGINTIPLIDAATSVPFNNGIAGAYLYEENTRAYISNAGRSFLDGGAALSLFSDYNSDFLPGTEYRFYGNYNSKNLRFFVGNNPQFKRVLSSGNFGALIQNSYNDVFTFNADLNYRTTSLSKEKFSENIFTLSNFGKLRLQKFTAGYNLLFNRSDINDSIVSNSGRNFVSVQPYLGIEFGSMINTVFGMSYSASGNSNFLAPYASAVFSFGKGFSLFGDYSPGAELITPTKLLSENMYFNAQGFPAQYIKKRHDLKAGFKFEYNRYFEFNGGLRYKSYIGLPYFSGMTSDGKFTINNTDAHTYGAFLNLLFHRGPYGYFYGSIEASETRDEEKNYIPYFPSINSSLTYGYDFPNGLSLESNLVYKSGLYNGLPNANKLPDYINLNFEASYRFTQNLKFVAAANNILDRSNYLWENYREIPLDIVAGISFIW